MARIIKIQKANIQDSQPGNYSLGVKLLSMVAILYAIIAFLNESTLHWQPGQLAPFSFLHIPCCTIGPNGSFPFWLSHWTEYFIIVLFGVWRAVAEKNPYTRKRLIVLTASVGFLWWLVPAYLTIPEPYIGNLPKPPMFPSLHTPGTLTFFLVLILVLLFGRRIICGWCCPCVGIRETVAFPFRINTIRTGASRKYYRHIKWIFFALYLASFILIISYSNQVSIFYKTFLGLITVPYFLSLLLSPWLGNRSYCRFICPYGSTFGLLNKIGFFGIKMDQQKCTSCGLCEKVCDMGIPVGSQGREGGKVNMIEECMGCARCVVACPTNALEIRDIRNILHPSLRQDRKHLLKRTCLPG
ncbi:MAG: 4Fe-4S dicluster domain-containing protein [Desulfobulbaceae bacterium]|nr:4Fe-4S dicluster domain-containing protein [Desulfobulbaceae bacterium]